MRTATNEASRGSFGRHDVISHHHTESFLGYKESIETDTDTITHLLCQDIFEIKPLS
jgi:hypothetical protein